MVFAFGTASSGVPRDWAATGQRPGVAFLPSLSSAIAGDISGLAQQVRQPGDLVVVSLHWGSNWGYDVPDEQIRFAHALIDGGVDVVHGHSSHHPRPVETYRDKLILYGCGDFIDDYEGIPGYEAFRSDLRLLYLVSLEPDTGRLVDLRMMPMRARRMRLQHASAADAAWLRAALERASRRFGTSLNLSSTGMLVLRRRSSG